MATYLTYPIETRLQAIRGREQRYTISGHPVVLPPGHELPQYQRRDPTYDAYAGPLLADMASGVGRMLVIDVGANVGDTAVMCLMAAPTIDVLSVEGNPEFASYYRRNTAAFAGRARLIERFVGPLGDDLAYSADATNGGFGPASGVAAQTDWVEPADLMNHGDGYGFVVWKSDIEGYDIPLLETHWDVITEGSDVLWFEYNPVSSRGSSAQTARLIEVIGDCGRPVLVYDNLGRRMLSLPGGPGVRQALASLTEWLRQSLDSYRAIHYLDIWVLPGR